MGKIMLNGKQYGVGGIERAEDISYDNTQSGMSATNVQGALDEIKSGLIKNVTSTLTTNSGGKVQGSSSDLGMPSTNARILSAYFNRGGYSAYRNVEISMYGGAGYMLTFTDSGSPVVSSDVSVTFYYIVP